MAHPDPRVDGLQHFSAVFLSCGNRLEAQQIPLDRFTVVVAELSGAEAGSVSDRVLALGQERKPIERGQKGKARVPDLVAAADIRVIVRALGVVLIGVRPLGQTEVFFNKALKGTHSFGAFVLLDPAVDHARRLVFDIRRV